MPIPVSRTEHLSCTFSPVRSIELDVEPNLAALGELHGVVDQVGQDLPETQRIAEQMFRDPWRDVRQELEALVVGLLRRQRRDRADHLVQPEVRGLDIEPAGLDLRKVEDVVDHGEQRRAGVVDLAHVVALLRGERRLERQMRQADDGVHRRADLVAHVREEHRLHLGGFFCLALGADELRRLGLELTRLLPGLPEQLLGPKVALQDLQAHGDDGQQFVEQGLLPRRERPEGCHFEDAEQRIGGYRRHGRRLHGRRLAETGGNAQVVRREIRQRERSPFLRALTHEARAEPDDRRDVGHIRHAVGRDAPQLGVALVEHVESGGAAAEHRHEVRQEALAELRQRGGALQLSRHARHVRLHPALFVHRRGALLEDVDRARQAAGFVGRAREWNLLAVFPRGNRSDRGVEGLNRLHDPQKGEKPQQAGQQDGRDVRGQDPPSRGGDGVDDGLARGVREVLVEPNPLDGGAAQPLAQCPGVAAPRSISLASSRRPAADNDMTCFTRSSHSRYRLR